MNLYEIAEQCNCWIEDTGNLVTDDIDLKAFAALVAAAERDRILAVIGDNQCECRCAEVVRARGETK